MRKTGSKPEFDIAVIIVNYNVKSFLNFCLESVYAATQDLKAEIIVVDNDSDDDSLSFLNQWHDRIILIQSTDNEGFAKACNKGLIASNAEYVLFLNPDTIISEDCLKKCFKHFYTDENIGAIGVKMIDGSGNYLPESKRGFPTPRTALFKMLGLSTLFPKSALFNPYYLGHLSNNEIHEVDVLTGAFFFMNSDVAKKLNGFDERFFMYGEDIDLSYRIKKSRKQAVYFPDSTIIHFKGESTEKSSFQYFKAFYGSMKLFVAKHYTKAAGLSFGLLLNIGIILSALFGFIKRSVSVIFVPLMDVTTIVASLYLVSKFWAQFYHGQIDYFEKSPLFLNIALYALVWTAMMAINGVYKGKQNIPATIKSMFEGLFVILVIYSLLGSTMRSSRAVIILGFIASLISVVGLKYLINFLLYGRKSNEVTVLGNESDDLQLVLSKIGYHRISSVSLSDKNALYEASNLVFSIEKIAFQEMIGIMKTRIGKEQLYFWDARKKLLIGSKSKRHRGQQLDEKSLYEIARPVKRFYKRIFDILSVFFLIPGFFIALFPGAQLDIYFRSLLDTLSGRKTLISYNQISSPQELPTIKNGFFLPGETKSPGDQLLIARDYALHYSFLKDLTILLSHYVDIVLSLSRDT